MRGRRPLAAAALATLCLAVAARPCLADAGVRAHPGERIYRDGILPSGEPVAAVVQGDIPVEGTMFSCASCHLRSGLGATEGTVLTLPTNGGRLFRETRRGADYEQRRIERLPRWFASGVARPAYDGESLARALRFGIDPAGRRLDETMPRYRLGDGDMALLVDYLRGLCSEPSPGVSAETITLATVVADDAPEPERRAMVDALRAYVESHNVQTRQPLKRSGVDFAETMDRAYRLLELVVWELHGDRAGWGAQLQQHLRRKPVFALVGGISGGDWAPVHEFCERERLPCILPLTDFPVDSDGGWYTLYFSRGHRQEGETAARFLRRQGPQTQLVVVHREGPAARRLVDGAVQAASALGLPQPLLAPPPGPAPPDAAFWRSLGAAHPGAAFLLALGAADLSAAGELASAASPGAQYFLSGSLLERRPEAVPQALRSRARLTWPWRLPGEGRASALVAAAWARNRGLPAAAPTVYERVYFIGWLLTDVLMMLGTDHYRDYLLDVVDMEADQTYAIATYPRLSFGPGQRFASKGCYVAGIGEGSPPSLTALGPWVLH